MVADSDPHAAWQISVSRRCRRPRTPARSACRREAGLAGQWLRDTQPPIDAVRCSTATRTRETLAATGIDAPVVYEAGIYEASPRTLIELVRLSDDDVSTLLVIGHAPGMPWTAWELAGNRNSAHAVDLSRKFPHVGTRGARIRPSVGERGPGHRGNWCGSTFHADPRGRIISAAACRRRPRRRRATISSTNAANPPTSHHTSPSTTTNGATQR